MGCPVLTEQRVMNVIRYSGHFCINPLRWRESGRVKLLESMRRAGKLELRKVKPDDWRYTAREPA